MQNDASKGEREKKEEEWKIANIKETRRKSNSDERPEEGKGWTEKNKMKENDEGLKAEQEWERKKGKEDKQKDDKYEGIKGEGRKTGEYVIKTQRSYSGS